MRYVRAPASRLNECGFFRKMAAWLDAGLSRNRPWNTFGETPWSIVVAAGATTEPRHRLRFPNYAASIGDQSMRISVAAAMTHTTRRTLTQSFFQHLLENETLRRVSREKGRFRSFLLGVLKLCLADEQMRRHTLKRGGRTQFISTDDLHSEELHHLRTRYEAAPDEILDARWAGVILERALQSVRLKCAAKKRPMCLKCCRRFWKETNRASLIRRSPIA